MGKGCTILRVLRFFVLLFWAGCCHFKLYVVIGRRALIVGGSPFLQSHLIRSLCPHRALMDDRDPQELEGRFERHRAVGAQGEVRPCPCD